MKSNHSIPASTVIPVLIYPDVREAVAWLSAAFGFAERVRIGENHRAQLRFGDGAVIVADVRGDRRPPRPGEATHSVMVRVEDARTLRSSALRVLAQVWVPGRAGTSAIHPSPSRVTSGRSRRRWRTLSRRNGAGRRSRPIEPSQRWNLVGAGSWWFVTDQLAAGSGRMHTFIAGEGV